MLMASTLVCGVERSLAGQSWRWRSGAADGTDESFRPDDLTDQLLLARGVIRDELERHRAPTIRGFMPDPSIFRDMDKAAERLAGAGGATKPGGGFGGPGGGGGTPPAPLPRPPPAPWTRPPSGSRTR